MAQFKIPVVVNGIGFARDVVQDFMDRAEFNDDVPDEYKHGFYDFGKAIVKTFDKLQKEGEQDGRCEMDQDYN